VRVVRVAHPEYAGQNDYDGGDGKDSPRNFAVGVSAKTSPPVTQVFGARKLQVREFLNLYGRLRFRARNTGVGRTPLFRRRRVLRGARPRGRLRFPEVVCIDLRLAQAGKIVADRFFVVQSEMLGVSADESLVEYASGELVEVFFFDSPKHTRANFCNVRNVIERDFLLLARLTEFISEFAHIVLLGSVFRPDDDGNIIGQEEDARHRQE
jgi:hypothetical protein